MFRRNAMFVIRSNDFDVVNTTFVELKLLTKVRLKHTAKLKDEGAFSVRKCLWLRLWVSHRMSSTTGGGVDRPADVEESWVRENHMAETV